MNEYEIYSPDDMWRQVEAAIHAAGLTIESEYSDYGHGTYFYVHCTPEDIGRMELPPGSHLTGNRVPCAQRFTEHPHA